MTSKKATPREAAPAKRAAGGSKKTVGATKNAGGKKAAPADRAAATTRRAPRPMDPPGSGRPRLVAGAATSRGPAADAAAVADALLEHGSGHELHQLAVTLAGNDAAAADVDTDTDLWGPTPADDEVADGVLVNLRHRFARRRQVEQEALSRAAAANLLGTSDMTVSNWLADGNLIGIKSGRTWRLPAWQFEPDSEHGVLPGIAAVRAAFAGGPVALSLWAARPSPDLDGRTPRDVLAAGDVERVVRAASALTAAGW